MKGNNRTVNSAPISFVCQPSLKEAIEEIAAIEGISTSDVVRRAILSDLRRRKQETSDAAAYAPCGSRPERVEPG
jgi:hypothetical protein